MEARGGSWTSAALGSNKAVSILDTYDFFRSSILFFLAFISRICTIMCSLSLNQLLLIWSMLTLYNVENDLLEYNDLLESK